MPEVILTGAAGRLEGRYTPGKAPGAPIALILHPHPKAGGHMNHPVAAQLFLIFMKRGFATLRFNFRGVGRSQGEFDAGLGELADAASALDWLQANNATASQTWVGAPFWRLWRIAIWPAPSVCAWSFWSRAAATDEACTKRGCSVSLWFSMTSFQLPS